jgi:TetR/AcrR family transcriptional regulator
MPRPTFFNLPAEKKQRVFDAAVMEFAQHRFSDASINRIIKAAGIPRGSFYQYFKNKEDLYLYVLGQIGREKIDIFSGCRPPASDLSFFDAILAGLPAIFEWVDRCPEYTRISALMALDGSAFIRDIIGKLDLFQQELISYLAEDQRRGLIRADVDLNLVAEIYYALAPSLLQDFCSTGAREALIEKVRGIFDIIINGIAGVNRGDCP